MSSQKKSIKNTGKNSKGRIKTRPGIQALQRREALRETGRETFLMQLARALEKRGEMKEFTSVQY